ncbi:hypothetical protein K505DRAFT_329646 [Melanomma pulvis-pyrius CBS 109.77]|uniref:Uncharacterized protein n=1 Tax=Melanomma pulvis-pyrius CBS 109.77 TaxID=1314802 RepID=A0A6A6WUU9_9PLEO|nr:hypothetical protein K505DRAFT_329646 [Melanomma pulvis-pyrius CBS 109.77]
MMLRTHVLLVLLALNSSVVPASARPSPRPDGAILSQQQPPTPSSPNERSISTDAVISIIFNSLMLVLQVVNIWVTCRQVRAGLNIAAGTADSPFDDDDEEKENMRGPVKVEVSSGGGRLCDGRGR